MVPSHYYLNPYANEPLREDETKVIRVQGTCVCAFLLRAFARVRTRYAHACNGDSVTVEEEKVTEDGKGRTNQSHSKK